MKHTDYTIPLPYPTVTIYHCDPVFARKTLEAYAGDISELGAVTSYMYYHFLLEARKDPLAEMFRTIGIVEMHHLSLLANLLIQLNMDPKYRVFQQNKAVYWDSGMITYTQDVTHMLAIAMMEEEGAIKEYEELKRLTDNASVCALLDRILQDEILHLHLFKTAYRALMEA